jgi:3-deoxy-manno-octulosonate cytidylyltransferase (CMP-KDO synthetase)
MIQHVYERAREARGVGQVWVATDDERIARAVESFGGSVLLTSADHPSGTHRVIEASKRVEGDPVLNLQGDEPLILPKQIEQVVEALEGDEAAHIATLCVATRDPQEIFSPHNVKVVVDHREHALYFSRAPIPFYRGARIEEGWGMAWLHIGLYGFRREVLGKISQLPPCPWDEAEQLEQLRFLYWGYRIRVVETLHRTHGVDRPEDLEIVERALMAAGRGETP